MIATSDDPRSLTTALDDHVANLRELHVAIAKSLRTEYLDRRKVLQQRRIEATARHISVERKLASSYAPLLLCCRTHKGVDEIYWATIHHGRYKAGMAPRGTIKKYLARGRSKGLMYDLRKLLKHARPWELDLVIEIEKRAACLRRGLQEISRLKSNVREFQELAISGTVLAGRSGRVAPCPVQPDENLPPGVMPTPRTLGKTPGDTDE